MPEWLRAQCFWRVRCKNQPFHLHLPPVPTGQFLCQWLRDGLLRQHCHQDVLAMCGQLHELPECCQLRPVQPQLHLSQRPMCVILGMHWEPSSIQRGVHGQLPIRYRKTRKNLYQSMCIGWNLLLPGILLQHLPDRKSHWWCLHLNDWLMNPI